MNNNGNYKLITCTGYYNTGSSAIGDLLREYDDVQDFGDYEVRFAHEPDGLADLEYNIVENNHRHNTSNAIKRFLKYCKYQNGNFISKRYRNVFGDDFYKICEEYVNDLIVLKTKSWWQFDQIYRGKLFYFIDVLYSRIYKIIHFWKNKSDIRATLFLNNEKAYFSYLDEKEFLKRTKKFTNKLMLRTWDCKSKYLVLDQLIPPTNIKRYERYFDNLTTFIVDRDPRDIYLLEVLNPYGVVPTKVEEFCIWFKIIREHRKKENVNSNSSIMIYFEDLVYHYESTARKICKFIGINYEINHQRFKYFNPQKSIMNTRIWCQYPKYEKEIKYIEDNLKEYLYDYTFLKEKK